MELDNLDVLLGMTIASIILGIGLSMFFIPPYTGYGAVVLAIGMMTLALMIVARPRVIERVKREIVFQPSRQAQPTPITPPTFVIPSPQPSTEVPAKSQDEQTPATTVTEQPPKEEATQPQTEEKAPEKKEEELVTQTPS